LKLQQQFSRYTLIGIVNTLIHMIVFGSFYTLGFSQAIANLSGFAVASAFSFIVNSKYTFQTDLNIKRYLVFLIGMASISYLVGALADDNNIHPIITLVLFSAISLILGFIWSKWVVFFKR